MFEAKLFSLSF